MPGKVIGTSMNVGYPGTQSRQADAIIQNRVADGAIAFGLAVKLTADNKWKQIATGDAATDVAGIAVREVVQANVYNPQSNPDYLDGTPADVMVRGNCIVKCQKGTPAAGSAVYVRITADDTHPEYLVGGFEAADDGVKTVQIPNIEWTTGVMDSNLACEVTVKTRAKG